MKKNAAFIQWREKYTNTIQPQCVKRTTVVSMVDAMCMMWVSPPICVCSNKKKTVTVWKKTLLLLLFERPGCGSFREDARREEKKTFPCSIRRINQSINHSINHVEKMCLNGLSFLFSFATPKLCHGIRIGGSGREMWNDWKYGQLQIDCLFLLPKIHRFYLEFSFLLYLDISIEITQAKFSPVKWKIFYHHDNIPDSNLIAKFI